MQTVFLDFETYFEKKTYSLSKMPTTLYVRDPRFKVLGCAVAIDDEPSRWLEPEAFGRWVQGVDWGNTTLVCHNTLFDGLIMAEHYGVQPARYACTQAMARALLPIDSSSLKNVALALGLGQKGDALVSGSDVVSQELVDYAVNDNDLCRAIYKTLIPFMPAKEMDILSLTLRWGCQARLHLDAGMLTVALEAETEARQRAIELSGYGEEVLSSNQKFAAALRALGLGIPTKISAATMEETEAFGKSDPEFLELMAEYPQHQHIWEGRLAAKSRIRIDRTDTMLKIAQTPAGTLPMQLNYYGGHTGRWSGTGKVNVQNLPRKGSQRRAIVAPPGYVICVRDASQIELRVNMWFCGQVDKVEALRALDAGEGPDLYKVEAADQFGKAVECVTSDERQFGKVVQLGCGFQMGWPKFKRYCAGGPLGMKPIHLSDQQAYSAIQTYRASNPAVKATWDWLQQVIPQMMLANCDITRGPVRFVHEAVELPNGMTLQYPGLRYNEQGNYEYGIDKEVKFLYGGKLLENIVQALARIIVAEQILLIDERYETVSSTHDEVMFLAREEEAKEAYDWAGEIMRVPPTWAPDLPLASDGGWSVRYEK